MVREIKAEYPVVSIPQAVIPSCNFCCRCSCISRFQVSIPQAVIPSCNSATFEASTFAFGFNTASGNTQLQLSSCGSCKRFISFNTASGNTQLQQKECVKAIEEEIVSIPQAVIPSCNWKHYSLGRSWTCFNTASGNTQLQPYQKRRAENDAT